MPTFNFVGKRFALVNNGAAGEVGQETIFDYQQEGDLVTADYTGGTIRCGKIVGRLEGSRLFLLYQCLTTDGELKAGKAMAVISMTAEDKMKLNLDWQWLTGEQQQGRSEYIEIDKS